MAKNEALKSMARHYFVEQMKLQREIAQLLNISENTVSAWVNKGGWKEERDARINGSNQAAKDIRKVLSDLAEQRIELSRLQKSAAEKNDTDLLRELNKTAAGISDETSKWNKTLQQLDGRNNVALSTYLDVMDSIFRAMQSYDKELHYTTIDFQEAHVQEISKKLG